MERWGFLSQTAICWCSTWGGWSGEGFLAGQSPAGVPHGGVGWDSQLDNHQPVSHTRGSCAGGGFLSWTVTSQYLTQWRGVERRGFLNWKNHQTVSRTWGWGGGGGGFLSWTITRQYLTLVGRVGGVLAGQSPASISHRGGRTVRFLSWTITSQHSYTGRSVLFYWCALFCSVLENRTDISISQQRTEMWDPCGCKAWGVHLQRNDWGGGGSYKEGWGWKEVMGCRGLHCGGLGLEGNHGVEEFTLWRVGAGRKSWGRGVYTVEGWSWKENMGWGGYGLEGWGL